MSGYYAHAFKWSDDAVARLKDLAAAGDTAAEIARQINAVFGASLSRNAIIGKLYRLGLPVGSIGPKERAARSKARRERVGKPAATRDAVARNGAQSSYTPTAISLPVFPFAAPTVPEQEPIVVLRDPVRSPGRCDILGLKAWSCRWIVEDSLSVYCGEVSASSRPYCPDHCKLAYAAPVERPKRVRWNLTGKGTRRSPDHSGAGRVWA